MRRTLGLLLLVTALFGGYLWFTKPQPPVFKALEAVRLDSIAATGRQLYGELVFQNPNNLRVQLGELEFVATINGIEIGTMKQEVSSGISKKETYRFPFRLRFSTDDIKVSKPYQIQIHGEARSTTVLANYSVSFQGTSTIP